MEESLPGFTINGLTWCGDPDSPSGIDYTTCQWESDACPRETSFRFWKTASREVSNVHTVYIIHF